MSDPKALHRKLQLKPGSRLWVWPEAAAVPEPLAATEDFTHTGITEADVAVLFTGNRADVDTVLTEHLEALATMRAVWIIYAKANKTDINRDTLWRQLEEYGWRAVTQVSYDDTYSALRVRPMKDGETLPSS
ncbi:hypothetical protein [Nesterenkonia muleiensis]|uniref:hypothetical protein n=1 Tax=Nesterenkonia muleiensis TaxID=2282648 RepID=UPI000E7659EF|nr:hypothetical protein [Nesterenkonia muleiensis]